MPSTPLDTLRTDIRETLDVSDQSSGRYTDALIDRRIDLAQDRLYAFVSRLGLSDYLTQYVAVELDPVVQPGIIAIPLPPTGRTLPPADASLESLYWVRGLNILALPTFGGELFDVLPAPDPYKVRSVKLLEHYVATPIEDAPPGVGLAPVAQWSGRTTLLRLAHREDLWDDLDAGGDWGIDNPPRYRLAQGQIVFDRRSRAPAAFLVEYHCRPLALESTDVMAFGLALMPLWQQYVHADVCAELLERDREFQLAAIQRAKLAQVAQELEDSARKQDGSPKRFRDDQTCEGYGVGDQERRDAATYGPWWRG